MTLRLARRARATAKERRSGVLEELDVEPSSRFILLPLRFRRQKYLFLLDTGASLSSFDLSLTSTLERPLFTKGVLTLGGLMSHEHFSLPKTLLGKLDLRIGGLVTGADYEGYRRVSGRDVRGALGMACLKHYVVRIDCDAAKVQFLDSDRQSHPEWGVPVPLYPGGGRYTVAVQASLHGLGDVAFVVDTGCSMPVRLDPGRFGKATEGPPLMETYLETLSGRSQIRCGRIGSLTLGGF